MKILISFFLIIFIFSSCGKKSEPKYQGSTTKKVIVS